MPPVAVPLVQLSTWWTDLILAHGADPDAARRAQGTLAARYQPAARTYLASAVRNDDVADDLSQEFVVKLVRGDFRNACPDTGRFRDYLRLSLAHLAADHLRRLGRTERSVDTMLPEPSVATDEADPFHAAYLNRLLDLAWERLRRHEADTGRPLATVLQWKSDDVAITSDALAARLTASGRAATAGWVRKILQEARARFADFLLAEVAASLHRPTADAVADELLALGLFRHCREAISRRWSGWAD